MACASHCYGCSKQTALSFLPAWLVPLPCWSQGLSSGLCALGHRRKALLQQPHRKNKTPSYSSRAGEWGSEGTRDWRLQEGQRGLLCPLCSSLPVLHCLPLLGAPAMSPGEGAALPPLSGGQSLTCCVPRGGWDRADLEPFALSRPGEHENIPGAGGSQLEGGLGLGQQVPIRDGLSGSWVSCGTFAHKPWLSMRVCGQGAGLVGAREGSCNP